MSRYGKSGALNLSAKRYKRGGNLLKRTKRQKERAAQREAAVISASDEQSLSSVQQISSVQTCSERVNDDVHVSPESANITDLIPNVLQNMNPSQITLSSATVESSSPAEAILNNNLLHKQRSIAVQINFKRDIQKHRSIAVQTNFKKDIQKHRSIATQTNFDNLKTPKEIFDHQEGFAKKLKRLPKETPVTGRRIIDFQYFFKALIDANNHSKDGNDHSKSGCDLNNIYITKEKKHGICSSYYLKCAVCDFEKVIFSEDPESIGENLNTDFASGILTIKCGFEDANVLLFKMKLPLLSFDDFIKEYKKVLNKEVHKELNKVDSNKLRQNTSKKLRKNIQSEPQLTAMQQCSSSSDNSSLLKEVDLGSFLVEDQFEIKEENAVESETESEILIPDQSVKTSDHKLIQGEEQIMLNEITIKLENDSDDDNLNFPVISEAPNKEIISENDEQSILRTMLPQQNEEGIFEHRMIANQAQVNVNKNVMMIKNSKFNDTLNRDEFNSMELIERESLTDFDSNTESELPSKKARTIIHKELSRPTDTQSISTGIPSKGINNSQSRSESCGLVATSSLTADGDNLISTSSSTTNRKNSSTVLSKTTGKRRNVPYLTPVQYMPKSYEYETLIGAQMSHNIASEVYQGANGTVSMTGVPSTIQQFTNTSVATHVPFASTGFKQAIHSSTSIPGAIPACCLSNVVPNANKVMYVPLRPTIVPQPVSSSNLALGLLPDEIRQLASLSNGIPDSDSVTRVSLASAVAQQAANPSNSMMGRYWHWPS